MRHLKVPVEEFTTPHPVTATEDMLVSHLDQLMTEFSIRHLPVVRGADIVGIISERDLRVVAGLSEDHRHQVRAGDIMATGPMTVPATAMLDEVARVMVERRIGSAIVTDAEGGLYGIFTATDALNALIEITRGAGGG